MHVCMQACVCDALLIGLAVYIFITKTSPCNEDPLTPHFYIVKQGFTGVYIFSYLFFQNIDCGYSLERINVYPRSMF